MSGKMIQTFSHSADWWKELYNYSKDLVAAGPIPKEYKVPPMEEKVDYSGLWNAINIPNPYLNNEKPFYVFDDVVDKKVDYSKAAAIKEYAAKLKIKDKLPSPGDPDWILI